MSVQSAPGSIEPPVVDDHSAPSATTTSSPASDDLEASTLVRPRRRLTVRRLIVPIGILVLLVAAVVGWSMYRQSQLFVSTDNAQLTATPLEVGSMNAGRVDSVAPSVGSVVHKGDTVAVVDLPSQVGVAQNGQPTLGFLNDGNSTVDVQAPVDGVVLAVPTTPGATVQPGQALVTMVDPSQLYVDANVEETNIARVKVGQAVTVHVDALGEDVAGRVEAVTPATEGTFSLLPDSSGGAGTFTKVTQLIPVRISLNLGSQPALVGSSVEVKIRVA